MGIFKFDANGNTLPLNPYWNFCVGSCHAATALREDYRQQLTRAHRELGFRYVRFHGLFNDDMSVLRKVPVRGTHEEAYSISFTNIDSVFDFLVSINMRPFVEIGFMPGCLRTKETTVFHYKGYISKPSSYETWDWLIDTFIRHLEERYGIDEVRQWFFEVWNEPNLGGPDREDGFWSHSMEDYFELYEHTARAIKKVDHRLKVGGPATSNNAWIPEFTGFCRENNVPVDFVSTHHYPTDVILGYGVEDSFNFFTPKEDETLEEFEERRKDWDKELWKHVDRGVLTEMTKKAVSEAQGLPVYYTEWNGIAEVHCDTCFSSSFILKTVMDGVDLVPGYSFWTFSDLFEEGGMPFREYHSGFGLMTLHGVPKANYRAFQLLNRLGSERYPVTFNQETLDGYVIKKEASNSIQVLLVNHNSLEHELHEQTVTVQVDGLQGGEKAQIVRVDETHGNSYAAWVAMGSSDYLSREQVATLEGASAIVDENLELTYEGGTASLTVTLPPMGAALVTIFR